VVASESQRDPGLTDTRRKLDNDVLEALIDSDLGQDEDLALVMTRVAWKMRRQDVPLRFE